MTKSFHNNTRRSSEYYDSVIRTLLACNAAAMTYAEIAAELNEQQINTPTGLLWTGEIVKGLMKKLRAFKTSPSYIAHHLMEMIFESRLSLKESLPLFALRTPRTL